MSQRDGLNRRSFLRNAGLTALAGAVSAGTPIGAAAAGRSPSAPNDPVNGKYDFDTIYNRFGTHSVKFDQQVRTYGKDSIQVGMGIADMDFRAAPAVTNAIAKRIEHENWGYLDMGEMNQVMSELVAGWNKKRYGLTVDPKSIGFATGVHPGLIGALQAFSPPGTKVALITPTYNGFYGDLRFTKTIANESLMKFSNGHYSIDFDDFEKRLDHDTNTFILCNPQNPTGNAWSQEDLLRLGEICLRRRVVVLADEIHCDFVTKGQKYTPFASLPNKAVVDNSITFKAASKSFGLAAHKYAWYFSTNPEILARTRENIRADISTLGLVANQGAYESGEDWLNQCVEYIDGNHNFAVEYIQKNIPMIKAYKPQGTYLMWLDVTEVVDKIGAKKAADEENAKKPAGAAPTSPETIVERWLVKNAKVDLNAGHSYGLGGANHMRMNIATSRKMLQMALDNIASALRKTSGTAM